MENLFVTMIQYSQPSTFFSLPARNNIELGGMVGEKDKGSKRDCSLHSGSVPCDQYNQIIFGLSKDVSLLSIRNLYLGLGLGAYIKSKSRDDERVNSGFTFGEKVFLGYDFGSVNTELFVRHFSNGTLTNKNAGYNFLGLSLSYNF